METTQRIKLVKHIAKEFDNTTQGYNRGFLSKGEHKRNLKKLIRMAEGMSQYHSGWSPVSKEN